MSEVGGDEARFFRARGTPIAEPLIPPARVSRRIDRMKSAVVDMSFEQRLSFLRWLGTAVPRDGSFVAGGIADTAGALYDAKSVVVEMSVSERRFTLAWIARWLDTDGDLRVPKRQQSSSLLPRRKDN